MELSHAGTDTHQLRGVCAHHRYVKAAQQAAPGFSFDYLNIDPPRENLLPKANNEIASVRNGDAGIYSTRQVRLQRQSGIQGVEDKVKY